MIILINSINAISVSQKYLYFINPLRTGQFENIEFLQATFHFIFQSAANIGVKF